MNKREIGANKEEMACRYLERAGLKILDRNFRSRFGEIDIVALDKDMDTQHPASVIVFVEVKYRKNTASGNPWEAVYYKKQRTICKVADYYRIKHGGLKGYCFRFDVISILADEITWYKNAFEYIG